MKYLKKIIRKIIKDIWGINGINLFIKKQKKKIKKVLYKKKYSCSDIISKMKEMGLKPGSVIFIHSSMSEFYNYTGTTEELIQSILSEIGEEGTLLMPAYPPQKGQLFNKAQQSDEIVFDVLNTHSGAGLLSEVFRNFPNVKRSINLQHSVCALGKLADYFTSEHHLSKIAWDEYSPYYKLSQMNALIFSLGCGSYLRNVTMIHCVETHLKDSYEYFNSFFGKKIKYNYRGYNDEIGVHEIILPIKGAVRCSNVIKKHYNSRMFKRLHLSNLLIEMVRSNYMFNKSIELTTRNINIYKKPDSALYMRNGKFIKK